MTISDRDLAMLCALSYKPAAQWDHVWTADEVHVTHKLIENIDVIVFRGSADAIDWIRDLEAMPKKHPLLGWCHSGFLRYMDLVFEHVLGVLGRNIVVTGHSLGAARASIMAGLLAAHGCEVISRVVFGEPRPGFKQLATILQQSGMELRSYRNGSDPVTAVPVSFEPLLRYVHASPLISLAVAPDENDKGLLREHHIELYLKGVPG